MYLSCFGVSRVKFPVEMSARSFAMQQNDWCEKVFGASVRLFESLI